MPLTDEGLIDIPGVASRWVCLANGARAHYSTSGDKGPAVILLHGAIAGSSGLAGFRFMLPFLGEQGFRVYDPRSPGVRPRRHPARILGEPRLDELRGLRGAIR
jgi:2-hydroxy-6-oxonona-2,4-dienedioate hydrolase